MDGFEGKSEKSKFQVTFQLQLENHHFESELKSDLKIQFFQFSFNCFDSSSKRCVECWMDGFEGKNQKSKFQVTFQLQLENHHFESELKSDLKFIIFAISLQLLFNCFDSSSKRCVECWIYGLEGKNEKSKFQVTFQFSPKTIILSQNWKVTWKFKKSIFVFLNSISLVYPNTCKCMQKHAKEIEKSVEWKRSDMKSAKQSVKMDVPSMRNKVEKWMFLVCLML